MSVIPQVRPQDLADEAVELARRWLRESTKFRDDPAAKRLAGVLRDPHGLEFTVGFVDGVIRPEDVHVAGANLAKLAPLAPQFLSPPLRTAVRLGGRLGPLMPQVVVPVARRMLRRMVGHLLIDASDTRLGASVARLQRDGVRLNINLLGEAILGQHEARRRLEGTRRLLARDDIDYVSIKVSSVIAPHNHWAHDQAVERVHERLLPLYRQAASTSPHKFINLDMEEYKDLDLTLEAFMGILERGELFNLEAGIVLQAYLPDALPAMMRLQSWAADRVARGGAPIKVRVVKGANLPMEQVEAALHNWPLATWDTKADSDTNYKAVLDYALRPDRIENVRIGVGGHNLFDIALAWILAGRRSVRHGIDVEMLLGMATGQAEAVKADVGSLLLYTPVVHPEEFDVAIAYLVRRLEEGSSSQNYMSAALELSRSPELFEREKERFLISLANLTAEVPGPKRTQDRRAFDDTRAHGYADEGHRFANTADTDPDLHGNREWAKRIAARMVTSRLGVDAVAAATITSRSALDAAMTRAVTAANSWQSLGCDERARILRHAAVRLEAHRAELLEVMGSECGKTLDQGDPEISEAIDFVNLYARSGQELDHIDGARVSSPSLTVVTPPWNFPIAIPTGGTAAALAAGSAVIVKPAPQAARTGALMAQCLWEAGVPRDVLQMVQIDESLDISSELIADRRVDRVILTGGYDTAVKFREFRQDLKLFAETSGKNAIIVTPNADFDLAAHDVAYSAFGHAGQKCSAASLVVLVGSASSSVRFRNQLLDAVRSMHVGTPDDLDTQMGPLISPPEGKLMRGLTTLEPGQHWVVEPQRVESDHPLASGGRLWTPGIRAGVERGSQYHRTEYFGPILGVMTAATLDEAIDIVNDTDYGLTSGLHSLDRRELDTWLHRVRAGNLYVNRTITGAIVRRQPFGGWKRSAIGPGAKAGGPNYLHGLVDWADRQVTQAPDVILPAARGLLAAAQRSGEATEWLHRAMNSDAHAWETEFGLNRDVSDLRVERNVLRYLPESITIRIAGSASILSGLRAIAAGLAAGAAPEVSAEIALPEPIVGALGDAGITYTVEDVACWQEGVARLAASPDADTSTRVRIVAAAHDRERVAQETVAAAHGAPEIALYDGPVVSAGRVEMLAHLREQAVSITAHRFGTPDHLSDGLV